MDKHFYNIKPEGVKVNKEGAFEMDREELSKNIYLLDEEEISKEQIEETDADFRLHLYFPDKEEMKRAKEILDKNFFEYIQVGPDHLHLRNVQTSETIFRLLDRHDIQYEVGQKVKHLSKSALGIDYDELEGLK